MISRFDATSKLWNMYGADENGRRGGGGRIFVLGEKISFRSLVDLTFSIRSQSRKFLFSEIFVLGNLIWKNREEKNNVALFMTCVNSIIRLHFKLVECFVSQNAILTRRIHFNQVQIHTTRCIFIYSEIVYLFIWSLRFVSFRSSMQLVNALTGRKKNPFGRHNVQEYWESHTNNSLLADFTNCHNCSKFHCNFESRRRSCWLLLNAECQTDTNRSNVCETTFKSKWMTRTCK